MDAAVKGKSSKIGRARQFLSANIENGNSTNQFNCTICNNPLNGNTQSNLLSHFKSCHKDVYYTKIDIAPDEPIAVQRLKLLYSCVELVSVNSQPFSLLSCSGFKSAVQQKLNAFKLAGCNFDLNDHHVREVKEKVMEVAEKIKQQLKMEMKGKVVSLMVDGATRNGRSIFGINAQYKIDGRLKLVTLSMRELDAAHTADYLSKILVAALVEYEIELSQVITITTDNGSNMLAMVKDLENKLFGDEQENNEQEIDEPENNEITAEPRNDEEIQFNDELTQMEIEKIIANEDLNDQEVLDILFDTSAMYEELLDKLVNDMRARSGNHHLFMSSIKCAAHTLQLAVNDAIKLLGKNDSNIISLCRVIAKFLRLQSTRNEMKKMGLKSILPRLDVETRWSSTYLMIRDVLKCRNVIEFFSRSNKSCELLLRKLSALEEMESVLQIPYLTTVLLQKNDFTLSDFYGCFQIIELKLKRMIQSPRPKMTNLAQRLLECMNNRKSKLLDTPLMLCAVFLDPRYKCTIESDHEKVQLAKLTIEHIWNRLKLVKGIVSSEGEKETTAMEENSIDAYYAELDLHLNQTLGLQPSSTAHGSSYATENSDSKTLIIDAISKYELSICGLRLKSSDSVHAFWEGKKAEFDVLYQIANIVFAIPPTQASVERNFSALKYMLTDKRYNLKPELLEALMLIHLNREVFYEIRKNEIANEFPNSF